MFQALGATLERVVITEVREHTFYAELHLAHRRREDRWCPAGRRDAIALAVRTEAPIFAEEALLDEAAVEAPEARTTTATRKRSSTSSATSSTTSRPDDFAS